MNPSDTQAAQETPSVRRRRRRFPDGAPETYADAMRSDSSDASASSQEPEPLPRRAAPRTARVYDVRDGLNRWPAPVRAALVALIAVIVLAAGVTVTRHYLAVQRQRRLAQEEAALKARHPLYYQEIIESAAAENNLNPALVCSVILCESSFDPQAESRLGARGLMQLMEPTAQWIAEKLHVENYSFDLMYDAETNVRFGAWYLGYLARRFDGDALKVVCAYHAGQGNVDSWLTNPLYSSDGITLTTIPTDDTAKYAKRVLSAYEVYEKYYYPPAQDADGAADAGDDAYADSAS